MGGVFLNLALIANHQHRPHLAEEKSGRFEILVFSPTLFFHKAAAFGTEARTLAVRIGQGIGEEHNAGRVRAMPQAQEVPQFVDGFLEGPFLEELRVAGQAIKFRLEAGQGDDGAFLLGIGQAKDEIKLWHKKIYPGYPQHQPVVAWPKGCQQRQKGLGPVLASPKIISPGRHRHLFNLANLRLKFFLKPVLKVT
jgi:hypothetical protein